MLEINEVYCMDCLQGMPMVAPNCVDLVLCDLPYGVLDVKNSHTSWDIPLPFDKLWECWTRLIKPNAAIILTGVHPFTNKLINSIPPGYKYQELIWYKSSGSGFLNAKKMPIKSHENILVIYKKPPIYNPQKYKIDEKFIHRSRAKKRSYSGMFQIRGSASENYVWNDDGSRYPDSVIEIGDMVLPQDTVLPIRSAYRPGMHPTEKPVDLFAFLIRSYTSPGALVLDNCAGAGTTAVAAILEGRNFLLFEKEEKYYQMCQERIASARALLPSKTDR